MITKGNESSHIKKSISRQALKDIGNIQNNNRKKKASKPVSVKSSSKRKNNSVRFYSFEGSFKSYYKQLFMIKLYLRNKFDIIIYWKVV